MIGAPRTLPAPIRRLRPETVERIAAGEVVERPASAVKELVENAYDAGARSVTVRLAEGGLGRIEVADDGAGVVAEELELAVERHATSKLPPDGPVEAVESLGFRGEALAAIAAVSRLRLLSRPVSAELAEGIEVTGGQRGGRFAAPRAPGTTVEVVGLFYNTPARRKFLHGPAREQVEVARAIEQLYLARPEVGLRLENETGELANYPASRDLKDAASEVFGPEFAASSFAVTATGPAGSIDAVLGLPERAASTSTELYVAVNRRPVVSRGIATAVRVAFGDAIPRQRFPVGVVHLTVDPARVDVNVHPTKREVRLAEHRAVEELLRGAVRAALADSFRPREAPRERSTPSEVGSIPTAPLRPPPPTVPVSGVQRTLPVGPAGPAAYTVPGERGRPRLELLGAVGELYWVAASDDGIVLIDQHAASERLLYDTLRAGGNLARQTLVEPVALVLGAAERAALAAHAEEVRLAGFEVEPFGPGSYRVLSVPSYRGHSTRAEAVLELLRELSAGGRPTLPDGLEERRAASIACHAAIRAGDRVEPAKIAEILASLDRDRERPGTCPHGRPIVVRLPRSRLDRWFLRSGG